MLDFIKNFREPRAPRKIPKCSWVGGGVFVNSNVLSVFYNPTLVISEIPL